jgi:hypothetical protein
MLIVSCQDDCSRFVAELRAAEGEDGSEGLWNSTGEESLCEVESEVDSKQGNGPREDVSHNLAGRVIARRDAHDVVQEEVLRVSAEVSTAESRQLRVDADHRREEDPHQMDVTGSEIRREEAAVRGEIDVGAPQGHPLADCIVGA